MFNLIIKDMIIQKKQVLLSFIYIIFLIFVFQNMEAAMFISSVIGFTYMLLTTSCAYEDKCKSDIMINSLPVKRSHVVAAKYLSVAVFLVMATLGYMLISGIFKALEIPLKIYPLSMEDFALGVAVTSLMAGLYLPLFFKLGYMKSKVISFLLFFGFFFGIPYVIAALQNWENAVLDGALTNFLKSRGDLTAELLAAAVVFILLILSYGLSLKFYKNREF